MDLHCIGGKWYQCWGKRGGTKLYWKLQKEFQLGRFQARQPHNVLTILEDTGFRCVLVGMNRTTFELSQNCPVIPTTPRINLS